MTEVDLVFTRDEFRDRLERTKARMGDAGVDLLVVVDPANMTYLTGFENWGYYTPQALLVALEADEPVLVTRHTERQGALRTTYLKPENIVVYPESYVVRPDIHGMGFVADVIRERFGARRVLGTEDDAICYTPRGHRELLGRLPESRAVDVEQLVNWVRTIKSPAEIQVMREAGLIAQAALGAVVDAIEPGVRECDAAAELHRAMISGTPDLGGAFPMRPSMPAGERTSASHLSWTDRPYRADEPTFIEMGGNRHQYHVGLSRTVYLGNPPEELVRLADVTYDGFQAAVEQIRPGNTCEDVAVAFHAVINKRGQQKATRIGYSLGIGYPTSHWIEQTASLIQGDRTVLQPNMTFHVVLGMWKQDWGYIFSETVAVTETGYETLSTGPQELIVKP
jgi:ectoine hydrolase